MRVLGYIIMYVLMYTAIGLIIGASVMQPGYFTIMPIAVLIGLVASRK